MAEYTIEQVKALTKKRHKHNAKPVRTDDGYFHSTGEYHRWLELLQLEQAGVIAGLTRQVAFPLHCATGDMVTTYSADFVYVDDGGIVVEDFKGHRTAMYRLKRKWMAAEHGIVIRETGPKKRKGK